MSAWFLHAIRETRRMIRVRALRHDIGVQVVHMFAVHDEGLHCLQVYQAAFSDELW